MKKTKKYLFLTLFTLITMLACMLFGVACGKEKAELTLNQTKLTMVTYDDFELKYELKNSTETVVWTSSNEAVVSVVGGKLTAKKEGVVTITASVGEVSATCEVTVLKTDYIPSLYVGESTEISLLGGGAYTFFPRVDYKGQEVNATFAFESSVPAVAEVTADGKVTAKADGETIITVKANFKGTEIVKTVRVSVCSIVGGDVTVGGETLLEEFSMYTTETMTVNVKTLANGLTDEAVEVEWSKTDDGNLVSIVQNGKDLQITANKAGTVTLKVAYAKGEVTGEGEYILTVMKKVFNKTEEIFIDKGKSAGGKATVALPSSVDATQITQVSVAGVTSAVTASSAAANTVTFAVDNLQSGEISLGFETDTFSYTFDNTIIADMVLMTKDDLTRFAELMNAKQTGDMYVVLGADIDYGNSRYYGGWPDSGGYDGTFAGTFDGRGYTISNLDTREGLFDTISGTVKNLILSSPVKGSAQGGAICHTNAGTIENCVVKTWVSAGEKAVQFAGLVHTNTATGVIKNCVVEIASYKAYDTVKQINAAAYTNKGKVQNCYFVTVHSDYTYAEVTDGLYATKAAFFADVTELSEEDGWNEYWKVEGGKLYFGSKEVL